MLRIMYDRLKYERQVRINLSFKKIYRSINVCTYMLPAKKFAISSFEQLNGKPRKRTHP